MPRRASLILILLSALLAAIALGAVPDRSLAADAYVTEQVKSTDAASIHVHWRPGRVRSPQDVLIHFHGAPAVAVANAEAAALNVVLITVNFNGLSSVYTKPFRDQPDRLQVILDAARSVVVAKGDGSPDMHWGKMAVSSFSAGYGAVRELLRQPFWFDRIDAIVAADSIYAGLQEGTERVVDETNMRDFRRFAQLAADGKKWFLVTHSYLQTSYASTEETANDMIQFVGAQREPQKPNRGDKLRLISRATRGNFLVLGYEGTQGEDHMQHLRSIGIWWKSIPISHLDP